MKNSALTLEKANLEKNRVALISVLAAILLTATKLIVGLATGSLGILSEAAHSGLDLVAAIITLVAVRFSGKPPDEQHTYGHGKIENLSAMFEAGLLLITCGWIIYEAIQRLFFKSVHVEASAWAFGIMIRQQIASGFEGDADGLFRRGNLGPGAGSLGGYVQHTLSGTGRCGRGTDRGWNCCICQLTIRATDNSWIA